MDIKSRIEAFRASMEKHGIDAAWISSPENHLYLSGFANPDGRIFITAEKAYLFADFRYAENARRLCSGTSNTAFRARTSSP